MKVDISNKDSDLLTYAWKADGGYFLSDNTMLPVNYWFVPFEEGNFAITVSVSNQEGRCNETKKTITVNNPNWHDDFGEYVVIRTFKNNTYSNPNTSNVLDVDFDSKSNMYVLDPIKQSIVVFAPNGGHLRTLPGKFKSPNELMIRDDKLYLIYNDNEYLERYNLMSNREFLYPTEKKPPKDKIGIPIASDVDNEGKLYVIEGNGPSIAVFERNGHLRLRFGVVKGELDNPVAICIDEAGYIYVLDSGKGEIIVYKPDMQHERSIKLKAGKYTDMHLDKISNRFHLVNASSRNILVIDASGKTVNEFGNLNDPDKIAMDKFNNVYVTDKTERYVSKFILKGNIYEYYGKFGTNPFERITNIAVDDDGSIFLLHKSNPEIIKVDKNGWELTRSGKKILETPISIVAGGGGNYIYVLDEYKVLQFSNTGELQKPIDNTIVKKPIDIESDKDGNLYILDKKAGVCSVYSNNGKYIAQIGTYGKELNYLYKPTIVTALINLTC